MKQSILVVLSLALVLPFGGYAASLKTDKDKISYTLGVQIGQDFKRRNFDIDVKVFAQAVTDMMAGKEPQLSRAEMMEALQRLQQKEMEKQQAAAKENLEKGNAFLAKNKKEKGIVALDSGVQYRILKEGKGKRPSLNNSVVAHYRGTLINGEEFDSSIARGQPATFPVSGVIKGWQEILQLMPIGSKWQVFIPSDQAYGERGAGANIGPNEALIFEIELIDIK